MKTKDLLSIFAFAHNEELILRQWLLYHSALAGCQNLHVVDNSSTDRTSEILREFAAMGVNIYQHHDYASRAEFLTRLMHEHKQHVRLLVPLDLDEFIALRSRADRMTAFHASAKLIRDYCESLPNDKEMFQFSHTLHSVECQAGYVDPVAEITSFFETTSDRWSKAFFRSTGFVAVAGGNHNGQVVSGTDKKEHTRMCLFHFHYLGYDETYRRAENLCRVRGYDLTDEAGMLTMVERGVPGRHRLRYILRYRAMLRERACGLPIDVGKTVIECEELKNQWLQLKRTSCDR